MAHRAKTELSGQFIGKFQCKIGYGKANPTPKVWVGGLGSWCTESLLWKEFDRFGAIKTIEYDDSSSQAYILYETVDAAQAAVQEMRGFPLGGPEKRLRVDFSGAGVEPNKEADSPSKANGSASGSKRTHEASGNYDDDHDFYPQRDNWSEQRRSFSPDDDREAGIAGPLTIVDLCRRSPKVWDGGLVLKNSLFPTQLHILDGNRRLAEWLKDEEDKNHLRITQRLRLDQSKLDDVTKRMLSSSSHAVFVGVPASASIEHSSPDIQSRPLRNLISYLKQKEAAGVISMTYKDEVGESQHGVLYCFPPCEYATDLLHRRGYDLVEEGKDDFLLIVVVCGSHPQIESDN